MTVGGMGFIPERLLMMMMMMMIITWHAGRQCIVDSKTTLITIYTGMFNPREVRAPHGPRVARDE